jgi:hypothetical protein
VTPTIRGLRADIVFSVLIGLLFGGIGMWAWWAREQHRALMRRLHPALPGGFALTDTAPPAPSEAEPEEAVVTEHAPRAARRPRSSVHQRRSRSPHRAPRAGAMSAGRFRRLQQRVEVQRELERCG